MKLTASLTLAALTSSSHAVTLLSQDFDTDPVNYTLPGNSSPFRFQASDPARYWALSNTPGISVNPGVTGNESAYLAAQNMNNDGDGTLNFETGAPGQVDFQINTSGYSDLKLSIDLAGMPTAETENFVRAVVDVDGDSFYETTIFNFQGTNNSPYIDASLGALSGAFASFANLTLPDPTALDGILRFRLEIFNDTNSQNEAHGVDNILITGTATIPEPGTALLTGLAGLALLRRRRS